MRHPVLYVTITYGEKSLAGLIAQPAFRAKLKWIADKPRPIYKATIPDGTFIFRSSVTAKIIIKSKAVPNVWSYANINVCIYSPSGVVATEPG